MGRIYAILGILCLVLALFLVLTLSGGKKDEHENADDPLKNSAPKILKLAIDTEPKTLDPIAITDTNSDGVARKVHSCLVRLDKAKDGSLAAGPELAEKFEISPDGKHYTFHLRKGLKFHNGREMKAEDAAYSLRRLLLPKSKRPEWIMPFVVGSSEYYKDNKTTVELGIKATAEYTLTIDLAQPFTPFIQHLCTVNCAIVPREAVEDTTKPFDRNPVGIGAFKLKEWANNQVVVLTRNESYFRGVPKLSEVHFLIVTEPSTRLEKFLGKELDATDIPIGKVKSTLKNADPEDVLRYTTYRTNYIGIGMPNGEFANNPELKPYGSEKKLRQALSYALDRDYLCNTIQEGRAIPAKGVLPPQFPGFKEGRVGWPKDIEKAKSLLAEAGYPDGVGLPTLSILYIQEPNIKLIAQVIQEDFKAIGIKVELNSRERNSFYDAVGQKPWQAFLLGWVADYPDPDNFLYVLFHSNNWGSSGNETWYKNDNVNALTVKARTLLEMKDRAPLYQQAEDIIIDECPWIITYHVTNIVLLRKNIKGIRENVTPLDTGTEFPQVDFAFVDKE